jgi:hypothetical protein
MRATDCCTKNTHQKIRGGSRVSFDLRQRFAGEQASRDEMQQMAVNSVQIGKATARAARLRGRCYSNF